MKWYSLLLLSYLAFSNGATVSNSGQSTDRNIFATEIYQAVATEKLLDNVVISPAAIQSAMALAYFGAKDKTANEMKTGLRLGSADREEVANRFGPYQQSYAKDNYIRLFNTIYINENLEFKFNFRDLAQSKFESNVEKADFHPPYNKRTAERINKAVSDKTNGRITQILPATDLNDLTEGVMVNAITFSGATWQKAFPADKISKRTFSTGGRSSFQVDTMWTLNNFKYGEFSNLDAKALELPYQNTDFSMLILLPNKEDGLRSLIQHIASKDVVALLESGMSMHKVEVHLPKFSVLYGLSLAEPFKKLGVSTMFTRQGDFGDLYRMYVSHYINSAHHKAYVEISEAGIEQPLQTGGLKNLFSRTKKFDVNHPFIFAIKQRDSIIFMGHIANYAYV